MKTITQSSRKRIYTLLLRMNLATSTTILAITLMSDWGI